MKDFTMFVRECNARIHKRKPAMYQQIKVCDMCEGDGQIRVVEQRHGEFAVSINREKDAEHAFTNFEEKGIISAANPIEMLWLKSDVTNMILHLGKEGFAKRMEEFPWD